MSKYIASVSILGTLYFITYAATGVTQAGVSSIQGALEALALVAIAEWYFGGDDGANND